MRWSIVVLLVSIPLASARADGWYFSEGAGYTKVKDELGAYFPADAFRIRIAIGMRRDHWALEGFIAPVINNDLEPGFAARTTGGTYVPPTPPGLATYGLDLKYIQPVASHLEVYLRGSMSRAIADGELDSYSGRGLGVGAGLQLKGKVSPWGLLWAPLFFLVRSGPMLTGSLWVDNGYEFYRLSGNGPTIDAQLTHLTFGFGLGSDF